LIPTPIAFNGKWLKPNISAAIYPQLKQGAFSILYIPGFNLAGRIDRK